MEPNNAADQRFQDLLEGRSASVSPEADRLMSLVSALAPRELPGPSPTFRRRLRSELLASASMSEEDLFAALLDGGPIEAPVSVRPLVAVASALRSETAMSATAPSATFRFQLRNTLVREAQGSVSVGSRVAAWFSDKNLQLQRRARFVGAMSMAVMALLGTSAVFAAASSSIPGDPLYGIKRVHESARLAVLSGEPEGRLRLDLARVRLSEVKALGSRGVVNDALYIDTLDLMDRFTTQGTVILLDVFEQTGDRAAVDFVSTFAADQARDLADLVPQLPPGVRPAARDSLSLVERTAAQVNLTLTGCGVCPDDPLLTTPTAKREGRAVQQPGCDCPATGTPSSSGDGGTKPADDSEGSNGGTPDPGNGTKPKPPTVDLPTETPDPFEEQVEDVIDDIVDTITETLDPLPDVLPSVPSTPDLGL